MKEAPEPAQGVIFVNYRRVDTGWAADLVASDLQGIFGEDRVFLDVDGIHAGDEFAVDLEKQLQRATVLIVMIGQGWLLAQDAAGNRRLSDADDWVRREIRTGLQKQNCTVVPVLVDNAELPDRQVLPEDIASLRGRQAMRVRQANRASDIETMATELVELGFRRLPPPGPEFSDRLVNDVAIQLQQIKRDQNSEFVPRRELILSLDRLFNRKAFRFDPIRDCAAQGWDRRLDGAYQTEKLLRQYERNVQEVAPEKYDVYLDILKEVGDYCMQMGATLFDTAVDENRVYEHVGKPTFTAQLPQVHDFPTLPNKKPIIPDEINDAVEQPRKRAVRLMNKFRKE